MSGHAFAGNFGINATTRCTDKTQQLAQGQGGGMMLVTVLIGLFTLLQQSGAQYDVRDIEGNSIPRHGP